MISEFTKLTVEINTNQTFDIMKTIKETNKARLKTTKTWGWHVEVKGGVKDGRDRSYGFGKEPKSENEARIFYDKVK